MEDSGYKTILWVLFGFFVVHIFGYSPNVTSKSPNTAAAVAALDTNSWQLYKHGNPNFTISHPKEFQLAAKLGGPQEGRISFTNSDIMISPATGDMNPTIDLVYEKTTQPLEPWVESYHGDSTIKLTPGDVGVYVSQEGFIRRTGYAFHRGDYNYLLEAITATDTMRAMTETMTFK